MATLPRWLAGPYRPWFSVKETRVSFAGERGKPKKRACRNDGGGEGHGREAHGLGSYRKL
ncbi:hypothetical protein A9K55_008857 [Cordyceps militaris]|uniref:Uncharacterized protein n=1 Tax=Cordyceps militaris TaxID=73501 RepID=A0A2H4SJB8_CORMI|nr:hypothetical protein A9K55_008857 [Cordyceps militaris]